MRYVLVVILALFAVGGLLFGVSGLNSHHPIVQALSIPMLLIGVIALSGVTICAIIEASTIKIIAAIREGRKP